MITDNTIIDLHSKQQITFRFYNKEEFKRWYEKI